MIFVTAGRKLRPLNVIFLLDDCTSERLLICIGTSLENIRESPASRPQVTSREQTFGFRLQSRQFLGPGLMKGFGWSFQPGVKSPANR